MVCVQKFHDFPLSPLAAIALKGFHDYSGGVLLAQMRGELNLAVNRIIVRDESANEPDHDGRRFRGILVIRDWSRGSDLAWSENGRKQEGTNASGEMLPAE